MKTLKDLFLEELAQMYDAEQRMVRALPKMIEAATCPHLRNTFRSHLMETEGQIRTLERVFDLFDEKARATMSPIIEGLLAHGEGITNHFAGSPAINAALIAAAQKIEHFEIAAYGCLQEWASLLGDDRAALLLYEILEDEKAADQMLSSVALARGNYEALNEPAYDPSENAGKAQPADSLRHGIRIVKSGLGDVESSMN